MKPTTVHIDGVGPVLFERSPRAKRINISIRPFKGARVAVPKGVSFQQARTFAHSHQSWISKHLADLHVVEAQQRAAAQEMASLNKAKAKTLLIKRLFELAQQHGFAYNRVRIGNHKTKWGSCSSKNHISLNIQLARLPQALIDYVLLHELVHTKIKHHGKGFWKELDKYVNDLPKRRSELSGYLLATD